MILGDASSLQRASMFSLTLSLSHLLRFPSSISLSSTFPSRFSLLLDKFILGLLSSLSSSSISSRLSLSRLASYVTFALSSLSSTLVVQKLLLRRLMCVTLICYSSSRSDLSLALSRLIWYSLPFFNSLFSTGMALLRGDLLISGRNGDFIISSCTIFRAEAARLS